ncbi:lactonase family protein [Bacteroidota bacterium]
MKNILFFFVLLALSGCQQNPKSNSEYTGEYSFFVGTYTDGKSEGIYKYKLCAGGSIHLIGLAAKTNNPSFLALGPERNHLLAVSEIDRQGGESGIKSFAISDDSLVLIDQGPSGGAHPCFVAVNEMGYILVANYTGGNVGLLKMCDDGTLSELLDVEQHTGQGITSRQESPHAHSSWFVPETNDIISVDLGTNELWFSSLNDSLQKLIPLNTRTLAMAPGAGPRHLTIHPNGKWIYVLNELDCTVTVVERINQNNYKILISISTLPPDFDEHNSGADIHITGDGKYLYTSNRGHNSIAVFKVDEITGSLTALGHQSTKGKTPRNFSLSPDERYLVVANQNSDNIVSFARDESTGLLKYVAQIDAPSPVCILF